MAINKALMYARLSSTSSTGTGLNKKMRLGATRLNFIGPKVLCSVNGTLRSRNFDRETYAVTQRRQGQTTELTIDFFGFTPALGQEVIVGAGAITNRLFRGVITAIAQVHDRLNQGRTVWGCTCSDWNYVADAVRNVTAKYTSMEGGQIALALVAAYAPAGFTANHVQGVGIIDEIQFTMQTLNSALQQLGDRVGGYFYWDFDKDLHFFLTDTSGLAPEALTSSNRHTREFRYALDTSDLRNRIYVEGSGSTLVVAQVAGATTLPLEDVSMFATGGGQAKLEAQLITYGGVSALTTGSAVAGLPQSPSAPTAAGVAGQSGGVLGTVSYKVAHRLPGGDSEVSAASSGVAMAAVSGPAAPAAAVNAASGDVAAGTRKYKVSYVTSRGETLASTATGNVTVSAVSAPGGAPSLTVASGGSAVSGNLPVGSYKYKATFVTSKGETLAGSASSLASIVNVTPPGALGVSATTGGSLTTGGSYFYVVTFVTAAGETTPSSSTGLTLAGGQNAVGLTVPTSSDARVTARRIYRNANGSSAPLRLVTTINDNVTTSYTDTTADASLSTTTATPTTNTSGSGQVSLTSIPTSADARVTARNLYRLNPGAANYGLLTTINDNSTTTYTDNTGTSGLSDIEPAVESAGGATVAVTSIPTSADARVVRRKIYRTEAGGTTFKLVTTIADNVTTTFTDNRPDNSLGDAEPTADTSGGGVVTVTVPIGGATVTARRIYRTAGGGAVYKLVGTINDNSTTTFSDDKADSSLGDDAPAGSTVRTEALSTTLRVQDLAQFPSQGWVQVDSQVLFHTGRSALSGEGTLTGIPTTGPGIIQAPIAAGASVVNQPHLTGIPASGAGALAHNVTPGDSVNLLVQVDDSASQALYGVRQFSVQDRRLGIDGANNRGAAELALRKDPRVSGTCRSSDPKMRVGLPWVINLFGISSTVRIESVTTKSPLDRPQPLADVEFASRRDDDLYAVIRDIREHQAR